MERFYGSFDSWSDVCHHFQENIELPDEVLLASYDCPYWEGYAEVVYRKGDRYYWASGSHCSCYGLEDQWDPEEYSREELVKALSRNPRFYVTNRDQVLEELIKDLQDPERKE